MPHVRLLSRFFGIMVLLIAVLAFSAPGFAQTSFSTASTNADKWLASQMASTGAIISYQNGSIGYTYDEAVAVIAFSIRGDYTRAKTILSTMQTLQNSDGSWYDGYYVSKHLSTADSNREVGPNAWIDLAAATYAHLSGDHTFDTMAKNNIQWFLQFQQSDGGINGGLASNGTTITWSSTEHNEDSYAVLTYFGYTTAATNVKSFLDNVVWNTSQNRFNTGRNDTSIHTDVNSWGGMALGPSGTRNYALGLNFNQTCCESTQSNSRATLNGIDFDDDTNDVWLEGTGQFAEAWSVDANGSNWNYFVSQIILDQDSSGGVQYSMNGTNNGYWTMSIANAVSSTGWLVVAIAQYNPFQP